jgi:hypothetical protein
MGMIGNAIGALILGALGWVTLEFVGRPVRNFFDLRRQVKAQMLIYYAAPSNFFEESSLAFEGQLALGNLSAELIAFGQSEWLAALFVKCLGFNAIMAGTRLATLADELGKLTENREENYKAVDKALRF